MRRRDEVHRVLNNIYRNCDTGYFFYAKNSLQAIEFFSPKKNREFSLFIAMESLSAHFKPQSTQGR